MKPGEPPAEPALAGAEGESAGSAEDLTGRDRIAWNVLTSWGGYLVEIVTGFVLPRLMDQQIGQTALGVWDFSWSCVAYFRLAQIGVANATSRYLARYRAMRDEEGLRMVASSTLGVSTGVALVVLLLTALVTWAVPLFFGSRVGDQTVAAQWVVALLGAGLAFNYQCEVFSGVLTGSHRWDLHNALTAGSQVCIAAAMIATLYLGGGLMGIALAHTGGVVLGELARMVVAYRVCPELKLRPSYFSRAQARRMLHFGAKASVAALARLLLTQANQIIVASHMGPAALALYARPNALLRVSENLVGKLAFVLGPTASSLQGAGRQAEIRELVFKGTRAATALVVPMTLGLVILGGPLLLVWMGPRYDQGLILTILALASAPTLAHRPAMSIMMGLNLHGYIAFASLAAAIVGVTLSIVNVKVLGLGLLGAALAIAIPQLVMTGFVAPVYVCRRLDIPLRDFVREGYARPLVCGIPFALVLLASRIGFAGRPALALLVGSMLGSLVLVPLYWKFVLPYQVRRMVLSAAPPAVLGRLGLARP